MRLLALLALTASAADHWTTYVCLRAPIDGWEVSEANPLADWLFASFGLVPGLLVDSAVTLAGLGFLLVTGSVPGLVKRTFLALVIFWTTLAVLNNLRAMEALGLSPLGGA